MAPRPKGYLWDFNPKPQTLLLIGSVQAVLRTYSEQLPLTARQVFYVLVGQFGYDKTEQAYARLCEALVKARRAQMIPFSSIRDDGTVEKAYRSHASAAAWWTEQLEDAGRFWLDRDAGQDQVIELWCEAAGMAPQLLKAVGEFGVTVYSTGGFSSVTVTHEVAERVAERERPTVFLHVGDYDPSGESIFASMTEDIAAFVADMHGGDGHFVPERVALTEDQVIDLGLPTAPAKRSDTRSRSWIGETCQAEALDPSQLRGIVREAVMGRLDLDVYDDLIERETEIRAKLKGDVGEALARYRSADE